MTKNSKYQWKRGDGRKYYRNNTTAANEKFNKQNYIDLDPQSLYHQQVQELKKV